MYDGWMRKVREKRRGKYLMTKAQIRDLLKLCASAKETKFIKGGVVYYIK